MITTFLLAPLLALSVPPPTAVAAPPAAEAGVHYVYAVRHGHYDRHEGDDDGRRAKLNALGHLQAKLTGERLAKMPVKIDRLVSSELTRAMETADDIGAILKITATRDGSLNECTSTTNDPSYIRDDTPQEIASCDAARVTSWERWFRPTPAKDTVDVLVCHGNVIRWMLRKALGADLRDWPMADVANGSLTVFAVRPDGKVRLVAYSDAGHIPPASQTWTGRGPGFPKK